MNNLILIIPDVLFILLYVSVHRLSAIVQKRVESCFQPNEVRPAKLTPSLETLILPNQWNPFSLRPENCRNYALTGAILF